MWRYHGRIKSKIHFLPALISGGHGGAPGIRELARLHPGLRDRLYHEGIHAISNEMALRLDLDHARVHVRTQDWLLLRDDAAAPELLVKTTGERASAYCPSKNVSSVGRLVGSFSGRHAATTGRLLCGCSQLNDTESDAGVYSLAVRNELNLLFLFTFAFFRVVAGTRGGADAGAAFFQQRLLWIANLFSIPSLLLQVLFVAPAFAAPTFGVDLCCRIFASFSQ